MEDDIEESHLAEINTYCDYNGNGQVDSCEVHTCIVMIENTWRDEYCPGYGHVYCDCPFTVASTCDGAWTWTISTISLLMSWLTMIPMVMVLSMEWIILK